jgi:U4/U6 small nuclear ribonucleoprotein PRP3
VDFEGAPKERTARKFRFNPKGKYTQIAEEMRKEQQLEALKQRIAETAKKAGLDSEFETVEKNIKVRLSLLGTGAYNEVTNSAMIEGGAA